MKSFLYLVSALAVCLSTAWGASISREPYIGAIVIDSNTGDVLIEDGADKPGYPASMLKLIDLFIVLDRVEQGSMRLSDVVQITRESARMGGSQVYLDVREQFTVEELLYALMIQSANDAAMALAIHIGGTRAGFVQMMNDKAAALGLSPITQFHSPHGLPPGKGQRPDMTTPRDFATLCRALILEHPEALKYTSETFRVFRTDPLFEMRTHNRLLNKVPGCDGLKTGYFRNAGFSIAATAHRDGARVIAVVLGSKDRKVRDAKATELLSRGLLDASRVAPPPPQPVTPEPVEVVVVEEADAGTADGEVLEEEDAPTEGRGWLKNIGLIALGAFIAATIGLIVQRRLFLSR
jgi:serine-type D-Ala-D-Ala carboxypeptidase (penicillin-binding protein 5/6)